MAFEASNVLRMRHNFRNWKDVNVPVGLTLYIELSSTSYFSLSQADIPYI